MKLDFEKYSVGESKGMLSVSAGFHARVLSLLEEERRVVAEFTIEHPSFKETLEPWSLDLLEDIEIPPVILRMVESSSAAGVGPMAAVAGAIVDEIHAALLPDLQARGENYHFVMENGGEILVDAPVKVTMGVYAGTSSIGSSLGFVIGPRQREFAGSATSSATIGHAMSLGRADVATVFCKSAALADAAATATCNATDLDDAKDAIHAALDVARSIAGVAGALVVMGEDVGTVGDLPTMIKLRGGDLELLKFVT